jgi:hypothetical protein
MCDLQVAPQEVRVQIVSHCARHEGRGGTRAVSRSLIFQSVFPQNCSAKILAPLFVFVHLFFRNPLSSRDARVELSRAPRTRRVLQKCPFLPCIYVLIARAPTPTRLLTSSNPYMSQAFPRQFTRVFAVSFCFEMFYPRVMQGF